MQKFKAKSFLMLLMMCFCFLLAFSVKANLSASAESSGTPFVIEKNDIESVSLGTNQSLQVMPGEKRKLFVDIFPTIAKDTAVSIAYQITIGEGATISGDTLVISENATIGETIEVVAIVDDVVSENSLVFTIVPILVDEVKILNTEEQIKQGETLLLQTKVLPENATDKNLQYEIVSGKEHAQISISGQITVSSDLESGDLEIIVRVSSIAQSNVYKEKTFKLYKPINAIVPPNASLKEVEQKCSYSFTANVEPFNATFGDAPVSYSVNVPKDIATIDQNGKLTISATAPIGTKIVVRIDATDGVFYEQEVTVVPVYATSFSASIKSRPTHNGKYLPGDTIVISGEFLEPFNITEANKVFEVLVDNENLAYVENNVVKIRTINEVSGYLPKLKIFVQTNQNGTILKQEFEIEIYVPVLSVSLSKNNNEDLKENTTYDLLDLLSYDILPANSEIRKATFELVSNAYATISNGKLVVKDNLPAGDVIISVKVKADGKVSNIVSFNVYKPTRTLSLVSDKEEYISAINDAERVVLSTKTSLTASKNQPKIIIESGAENIVGNYKNGQEIGYNFQIKTGLVYSSFENRIVLVAEQDGVVSRLIINIYIPNEIINVSNTGVDRGTICTFNIDCLEKVSNKQFEVISKDSAIESLDIASCKVKIKNNIPAGTVLRATIRSKDKLASTFEICFTVNKLSFVESEILYADNRSVKDSNKFNILVGADSEGISILSSTKQLMVGRSTTFIIEYKGQKLSDFGLNLLAKNTIDNFGFNFSAQNDSIDCLLASGASGRLNANYTIEIQDGTERYLIVVDGILASFRGISGIPQYTNGVIWENGTKLELSANGSDFDTNATYGIGNLEFATVGNQAQITKNGVLIVTSSTVDKYLTVQLSCDQTYNTETIHYEKDIAVELRMITLNKNADDAGTSQTTFVGIDGTAKSVSIPTRPGYIFDGYYSNGTQYFDGAGNKVESSSFNANREITELTANWSEIKYNIKITIYVNDSAVDGVETVEKTYTEKFERTFSRSKCELKEIKINNVVVLHKGGHISVCSLTTVNGDDVSIDVYFKKSCLTSGTLITLADGSQKKIEDLEQTDMVLVWNFFTGSFDSAPVAFMFDHGEDEYVVTVLKFEDGTEISMIAEHGFYDATLNEYVFIEDGNVQEFIGHEFLKQTFVNGENKMTKTKLVSFETKTEITNAWAPLSYSHMMMFANGLVSVSPETTGLFGIFEVNEETLCYDKEKMQEDIEKYGLCEYETSEFSAYISKEVFDAFNGKYIYIALAKGLITEKEIYNLVLEYQECFTVEGND